MSQMVSMRHRDRLSIPELPLSVEFEAQQFTFIPPWLTQYACFSQFLQSFWSGSFVSCHVAHGYNEKLNLLDPN